MKAKAKHMSPAECAGQVVHRMLEAHAHAYCVAAGPVARHRIVSEAARQLMSEWPEYKRCIDFHGDPGVPPAAIEPVPVRRE
jgi:hypothetical protein